MHDSARPVATPKVQHSDALPAGTRLGEFELLRLLGVGGFGMVYEAYDHSLHRAVAIKEYMPAALAGRGGAVSVFIRSSLEVASYQAGLQSFVAEARLLAQFDHPALVKVFRFWEANNTAYMVMPLYVGMTLKQARSQMRHPPSEDWLRPVLWSVLEALKLLHGHGTVHRDVSPDNIFLQDNGPPVLLDLGAARRAIGDISRRHTAVLKVNYAPIEQYADARDMAQGPWSDLYSLAAVVHGCLANEMPPPATFRILRDRMPSLWSVAQSAQAVHGLVYTPAFVDALDRCLAIRPEARPQSVADFADAMGLPVSCDMARFDWRAAMGDGWQLSPQEQAQQARPGAMPQPEQPTQFVYPPRLSADVAPDAQGRALVASGGVVDIPARRPGPWALALALVAAMGLGAGGFWWLAPVAVPVAASPLALPAPLPAVVEAAPVPEVPAPAPSAAVPAKRAPAASVAAKGVVRPAAGSARHLPDAAQAGKAGKAAPSPVLCADSNFFTRPMCLYQECQKPEFAALPVCVENTQRLLANQRSHER